jgi:hypothetical protein
MAEAVAHLKDHAFPRLPVRQWVLWIPKQLRYLMRRDGAVLRIFFRVIARTLQTSRRSLLASIRECCRHIPHRYDQSVRDSSSRA